jgi:hypothetical protein
MERQLAVCQRHRPPVMVKVPALRDVLDVWWVCLTAAWEGRHLRSSAGPPPRAAIHPAAVSCAPCGTVHIQPSTVHCKQGALSACRLAQPFAHPQRCNVNDASYVRRC